MTETGCKQCGENTFSEDGASSCTKCPDGKISSVGSTSLDDCYFGKESKQLGSKSLNAIL